MKIFAFRKNNNTPRDYEQFRGFVVIAEDEETARKMIEQKMIDDYALSLKESDFDAEVIGGSRLPSRIVMEDYLRG